MKRGMVWLATIFVMLIAFQCVAYAGEAQDESVEAFVTRCYRIILSRNPDQEGLANWVKSLTSGNKSAAEVVDGFVNSQEFQNKQLNNADSVEILYNAMLNRGSDAAGKEDWVNRMNKGASLTSIVNGFCGSMEFGDLCDQYGINPGFVKEASETTSSHNQAKQNKATDSEKIRSFVTRCYRIILSRDPDEEGLNNWTNALASGDLAAANIIEGFIDSVEFTNKNLSDADTVEILYNAMLDRDSDADGKANWVRQMSNGSTLSAIINGFCGSMEFSNLCDEYGIAPGKVTIKSGLVTVRQYPVKTTTEKKKDESKSSSETNVTTTEKVEDIQIPFDIIINADTARPAGDPDVIIQEGCNGVKRYVYIEQYADGVMMSRICQSEVEISAPVPKIINRATGEAGVYVSYAVEKEVIPYTTETIEESMLYVGDVVTDDGVDGEKEVTYEIKKDSDGNIISQMALSENIIRNPVSQKTYVGTFVPEVTYEVVPLHDFEGCNGTRCTEWDEKCQEWAMTMAKNNRVEHSCRDGGTGEFSESVGGFGSLEELYNGGRFLFTTSDGEFHDAIISLEGHGGTCLAWAVEYGSGCVARTETLPSGGTRTVYFGCARGYSGFLPGVPDGSNPNPDQ